MTQAVENCVVAKLGSLKDSVIWVKSNFCTRTSTLADRLEVTLGYTLLIFLLETLTVTINRNN